MIGKGEVHYRPREGSRRHLSVPRQRTKAWAGKLYRESELGEQAAISRAMATGVAASSKAY